MNCDHWMPLRHRQSHRNSHNCRKVGGEKRVNYDNSNDIAKAIILEGARAQIVDLHWVPPLGTNGNQQKRKSKDGRGHRG